MLLTALLGLVWAWTTPTAPSRLGDPAGPDANDAGAVALGVGPHRFRIPPAYFRYPPHPSGTDDGFLLRALLPGLDPETAANRYVFNAPWPSEDWMRVVTLLFQLRRPGAPIEIAPGWLNNFANRGRGPYDASLPWRLDGFAPPSEDTFGLRLDRGRTFSDGRSRDDDLYWGRLEGGAFVGLVCSRLFPDGADSCLLLVDWRGSALRVRHDRDALPRWREIAAASLALMDRLSVE